MNPATQTDVCTIRGMLILLLVVLVLVEAGPDPSCSQEKIVICSEIMWKATVDNDFGLVTTDTDLDKFCREVMSGRHCIESAMATCSYARRDKFELMTSSAYTILDSLCDENSEYRKKYLDHSKCIREVALNDVDCSSLYLDILTTGHSPNENVTMDGHMHEMDNACCTYDDFYKCAGGKMDRLPICNKDSFHFLKELVQASADAETKNHCDMLLTRGLGCGTSSAKATNHPSHPLLLLLLLPFLISK